MSDAARLALRQEILTRCSQELRDTRDTEAIAAFLSLGRTRPNDREIGHGLILETLGLDAGNQILDLVHTTEGLRFVRPLLEQGRLMASSVLVRAWLLGLVAASILTQEQADAVTALGMDPDPVGEFDVRCACWSDTGEWLV